MLHALRLSTGVIVAVTFQQVDRTPDTKTGAERHNESLQYADCTVEKCHTGLLNGSPEGVELVLPDLSGPLPYPSTHLPLQAVGASGLHSDNKRPGNGSGPLCIGSPEAALSLYDIEFFFGFQFHAPVQILLDVKSVFLIEIGRVLVVRVLGDIVLVRQERPDASELEDALAAVHDSQFIPAHQFFSKLLVVGPVARAVASCIGSVDGINGFLNLLEIIKLPREYEIYKSMFYDATKRRELHGR